MILFDIPPIGGGVGIGLAVVFFLIVAAVALIAFKILKRTVKMAFRMAIVAIILLIAVIGGIAFLAFSAYSPGPESAPVKTTR